MVLTFFFSFAQFLMCVFSSVLSNWIMKMRNSKDQKQPSTVLKNNESQML